MTGSLNRKLEDLVYRAEFEHRQRFLSLEIQILLAMEDKGWSYEDLAKAVGTSRQNIWRDLKNGGLHKASLDRVARIAKALGLHVHHVLLSPKRETKILPKLQKLLRAA
jgi:transcriptional regulator with XRE-family HTH domain